MWFLKQLEKQLICSRDDFSSQVRNMIEAKNYGGKAILKFSQRYGKKPGFVPEKQNSILENNSVSTTRQRRV